MFPCNHAPDKSPRTAHGFKDATTDPARVNGHWNAHPGASIGMPTGGRSGVFVLDKDRAGAQEELEAKIGRLPRTRTVRTPRGGKHLYFKHQTGITNSPGALPKGIDVRGEGGYVLVPPSPGYEVEDPSPVAEAPAALLELLKGRSRVRETKATARPTIPVGEIIEEGDRNRTLFFEALRLKDADKGRGDATAELLAVNEARCSPQLDAAEVEGIVKSAFRYPVRSGDPTPEVLEAVERLEAEWWRRIGEGGWKGVGGKTDRDVDRFLIELARRYGCLLEDGSVAVSAAVRSVALGSATSFVTVSGSVTKRLARAGLVRKIDAKRGAAQAATWVLLPPRNQPLTHKHYSSTREKMPCVKDQLRPRVWHLETPAFRWRGPVGKGRATVLYLLELYGSLSLEALADAMGWGNRRELRRRYLTPLIELGLVEDRGGAYALQGDHRGRVEEVRRIPHGGGARKVRRKTSEGRVVTVVEEFDPMSEAAREERDRRRYDEQSRRFREVLEAKAQTSEEVTQLLNRWDEEREASACEPEPRALVGWIEEDDPAPEHHTARPRWPERCAPTWTPTRETLGTAR